MRLRWTKRKEKRYPKIKWNKRGDYYLARWSALADLNITYYSNILMNKKLMLVSASKVDFTSKRTGQIVHSWKYIFLSPEGKYITKWGRDGAFVNDATNSLTYQDALAREYPFRVHEWRGEIKEVLEDGQFNSESAEGNRG